jgi:hypothetical protein
MRRQSNLSLGSTFAAKPCFCSVDTRRSVRWFFQHACVGIVRRLVENLGALLEEARKRSIEVTHKRWDWDAQEVFGSVI